MGSQDIRTALDIYDIDADLSVKVTSLPKQYITGDIRAQRGSTDQVSEVRSHIQYIEPPIYRGGQGVIRKGVRKIPGSSVKTPCCVKSPQMAGISLSREALIQWIAAATLNREGIAGAVPQVYDLFQYAGETRFSMEYIEGVSAAEFIATSTTPEKMMIQVLAQTAILLSILQRHMRLDHRDLKGDNLWIRSKPISYSVMLGGSQWRIDSPFQVVILDFGFACIGGEDGNAIVSLSDGILPLIDPCPKEGRDMLHLIVSFWFLPCIREKMAVEMKVFIEGLMRPEYIANIKGRFDLDWVYMTSSDTKFRYPPLEPVRLLKSLADNWKGVGSLQKI